MAIAASEIVLENRRFRLTLSASGAVVGFLDKSCGRELCALPGETPFCSVQLGQLDCDAYAAEYDHTYQYWKKESPTALPYEEIHPVTQLTCDRGRMTAVFGDSGVRATFQAVTSDLCVALEVTSVTGPMMDALTVASLPLTITESVGRLLNACYDGAFFACVMALTRKMNCFPMPRVEGRTILAARCNREFGMVGERVALIGCRFPEAKQVLAEIETAFGLPSPRRGSKWVRDSEEARKSYFFIQFQESEIDALMEHAKTVPFGMTLLNANTWAQSAGHYRVHPENLPGGEEGLKRVVDKIHAAGMTAGMHLLTPAIMRHDPYATPVPDRRLCKPRMIQLAAPVDEKADFLPTVIAPTDFPAHRPNETWVCRFGQHLQAGDEIIKYESLSLTPPYGFHGCRRGACGTRPSAHPRHEPVFHLLEIYDDFIADGNTDIIEEMTDRVGGLFNRCGFDMMYLDASERLQTPVWYYKTRIQMAYYERLKNKDVFFQGSSFSHYTWHLASRQASADGFRDIKGYLDRRLKNYPQWCKDFVPMEIGWYAINDRITFDEWEYVLNKSLGYGCSVSVHTTLKALNAHPAGRQILEMIRDYEKARLEDRLSEEDKARLRTPGKQFELIPQGSPKWTLRPRT